MIGQGDLVTMITAMHCSVVHYSVAVFYGAGWYVIQYGAEEYGVIWFDVSCIRQHSLSVTIFSPATVCTFR